MRLSHFVLVALFMSAIILVQGKSSHLRVLDGTKEEDEQQTEDLQKDNNQQQSSSDDSSSLFHVLMIALGCIVGLGCIYGCFRGIQSHFFSDAGSSFAELAANIEMDKLQMIPQGKMKGMGSSSSAAQQVGSSHLNTHSDDNKSPGLKQMEQTHSASDLDGQKVKKFSKRTVNNSHSTNAGAIGIPLHELDKDHQAGPGSQPIVELHSPNAQQISSKNQEHVDTSVQNNFFSIDDGDDEEKNEKIINSVQVGEYQSDDTTYSNVFNLEGEEEISSSISKKKKHKKKQANKQNHLFFDQKQEDD